MLWGGRVIRPDGPSYWQGESDRSAQPLPYLHLETSHPVRANHPRNMYRPGQCHTPLSHILPEMQRLPKYKVTFGGYSIPLLVNPGVIWNVPGPELTWDVFIN